MTLKPTWMTRRDLRDKSGRAALAAQAAAAAEQGNWEEAAARWSALRDAFPNDLEAYVAGAEALRNADRNAEAIACAAAGLTAFPDEPGPLVQLGWSRWVEGDVDETFEISHHLVENFPDMVDGYALGVISLVADGHFDAAEALCEEGRERFSDDETLEIQYALLPSRRGDWAETVVRLQHLRVTMPDIVAPWSYGIVGLRELGALDQARVLADAAIDRFPDAIEPQIESAWIEGAKGNWAGMLELAQGLRERFQDDPRPITMSVSALRSLGAISDAEAMIEAELDRFVYEEALWTEAGLLAIHQNHWRDAELRLNEMRQRFPHSVTGWSLGAMALRESGQIEAAEALLANGFEQFPEAIPLWTEYALLAVAEADHDVALSRLDELREHFPTHADAYRLTISTLREKGDLEAAAEFADTAVEQFPYDYGIANECALVAADEGDWAQAALRWSALREQFPTLSEPYVNESIARRNLGELDRSSALLDEAQEKFPVDARIAAEIGWLACDREAWDEAITVATQMCETFPDVPEAYLIGIFAYRMVPRPDDAEALACQAIEQFPDNLELAVQHGWTAIERQDWPTARQRWESIRLRFPEQADIETALIHINQSDQIAEIDAGIMTRPAQMREITAGTISSGTRLRTAKTSDGQDPEALRQLLLNFESLGDNCEFGVVQSRYSAVTLGLLRWGTIRPEQLIAMLDAKLDGVGLPENTYVDNGHDQEYGAGDKRYFYMHTFIQQHQASEDQVLRQMCRRLSFLKEKFIQDLEAAEKIFVYKTREGMLSDDEARGIWQAMQAYGPNKLLCVRPTEDALLSGRVELMRPGLAVGYIKGLMPNGDDVDDHLDAWVKICEKVAERFAAERAKS